MAKSPSAKFFRDRALFIALFPFSAVSMAGMLPEGSGGEEIWQIEVNTMYVHQTNVIPQLYGLSVTPSTLFSDSTNPLNNLAELIAPDPEERWGVGGRLGYVFDSHKYDIQLRYFGIDTDSDFNGIASINGTSTFPLNQESSYDFNSAELMFGVYYKPVQPIMLRLSYGIAFVDIEQKTSATVSSVLVEGTTDIFHDKSSFYGFGPKFRVDGQLDIVNSFSVVGKVGVSTLFGQSKEQVDLYDTLDGTTISNTYNNSQDPVAIGFDTKLGVRYAGALGDRVSLNIEAGYQFDAYLNALQKDKVQQTIAAGELYYAAEENYTISGPYISLSMDFF